ncbi:MAG: hypothetical protein K2X94_02530 [Amoebophilaceae bacterium]|nr:hypothetical protein [Amoebophilaceae bacterium]
MCTFIVSIAVNDLAGQAFTYTSLGRLPARLPSFFLRPKKRKEKNPVAPEQKGAEICIKILSQLRSLLQSSIAGSLRIFIQVFSLFFWSGLRALFYILLKTPFL